MALLLRAGLFSFVFSSSTRAQNPEKSVIHPGVAWFDTDGNRIYAGGANIYTESGIYYLIGEGKKVLSDCSACFNLYSSQDLVTWKFESCLLNNSNIVAPPPFNNEPYYRMERPKIFKCPGQFTNAYRLWFHCDTSGFAMKSVGVLTSEFIKGPYTFASPCFRPDGEDSYDMGAFVDVRGDNKSYLVRSVMNQYAGISQMNDLCTNTTGIVSSGPDMEGQALMRDTNGTLHLLGSHLTGWAANPAIFVTSSSSSLVNAVWTDEYNPTGSATTYESQSTYIFPYVHSSTDGHITHMAMFDRWNENGPGGLDNATLVWLPLIPPSGGVPNVSTGWNLQLTNCDTSDATQLFTIDATNNNILHSASGLCVSAPQGSGNNLQLESCNNSPNAGVQTWYVAQQRTMIASTKDGSGNGCLNFNNVNNVLPAGNPIIAYDCSPSQWNALWKLPATDETPAVFQALDSHGHASGMCAQVVAPNDPSLWSVPWFDSWSLSDY